VNTFQNHLMLVVSFTRVIGDEVLGIVPEKHQFAQADVRHPAGPIFRFPLIAFADTLVTSVPAALGRDHHAGAEGSPHVDGEELLQGLW
jgi:hypothetical protein